MKYFNKIIYIHGFGSSCTTPKAQTLRAWCNDQGLEFVGITYTDPHPDVAMSSINEQIHPHRLDDCIIVGHSLGGFWANIFARALQMPCVLLNPSMFPGKTLAKYKTIEVNGWKIKSDSELYLYDMYERRFPMHEPNSAGKIVFVTRDDEVIDSEITAALMESAAEVFVVETGKHTFADIAPVLEKLEHLVGHGVPVAE